MEKLVQITAGRGPKECAYVVVNVLRLLEKEAKQHGITCVVVSPEKDLDLDAPPASVIVRLTGTTCDTFVKSWLGSIQWIGESPYRKNHRRKNWFIGVFEVNTAEFDVYSTRDFTYQTMRSSGAGGQHVNKVSSAVRALHTPTGQSVVVMDNRSQHMNKQLATERLMARLNEKNIREAEAKIHLQWTNQLAVERGNPTRVLKNTSF